MPTLTFNEGEVIDAVRAATKIHGDVPAYIVRNRVWDDKRIGYDAAQRALRGLVDKGLLEKPKRGYYRVATALRQDQT